MLSSKHANKNTNLSRKHSIVSTKLAIKKVWIIRNHSKGYSQEALE